ncbi:MAG: hypothetical protein KJI71_01710 [Patescibacteria group bacterium]|nr:hypothetical protein [Patescibacteria group bacterium]
MVKKLKKAKKRILTLIFNLLFSANMEVGSYFRETPHSNFEPNSILSQNTLRD